MKPLLLAMAWGGLFFTAQGWARRDILIELNQLEAQGQFREAAALASRALEDSSLPAAERRHLAFELDRLERIRRDFPFTKESLFAALKNSVKDLRAEEYDQWIDQGRFESREIDGERRFMVSSVPNLFFRYPELESRRVPPRDAVRLEQSRWETCVAIKKAAQAQKRPYVLPKRFHATMTVTVAANAAPAGEIIRAWLPIPRGYPFQGDFQLLWTSSSPKHIDDEQNPIRALYLEQLAAPNKKTLFSAAYAYTTHGVWFDLKAAEDRPGDPGGPALEGFLAEGPHVTFTPEIRALSRQIVGQETHPCRKARKCYDWIAEHIQYSYALEYSTIRNISDYCLRKGYGDCGQASLLFITLCRLNGIPARWQSGWNIFPGEKTIHDWSEIYLAPCGWVPVDPYMGVYATRYATSLKPEQRLELREFYFGGLDQYRMAANSGHNQTLTPPKQSMRSDDVDFQRGELEWGGHNIYFDQYTYSLTLQEMKVPARNEPAPWVVRPELCAPEPGRFQ
jgi:transglutaminase-like putative cysteine protease